jgi:hypothetical protein
MPGDKDIPDGILEEVELDYVVIDTTNAEKTGKIDAAADWFCQNANDCIGRTSL